MKKNFSLKVKITSIVFALLALSHLIVLVFVWYHFKAAQKNRIVEFGKVFAYEVEQHAELAEKLRTSLEIKTEDYKNYTPLFEKLLEALPNTIPYVPNAYLYSPNPILEHNKIQFLYLVGNPKSYSIGLYPGFLYESSELFTNAMQRAAKGEVVVTEPFQDEFGEWISVLYPVQLNRRVVVIYGFDFDYRNFIQEMRASFKEIIFIVLLIGVIFHFGVLFYLRFEINPLVELSNELNKASNQKSFNSFDLNFNYSKLNEIGILYKSFHKLLFALKGYINSLQEISQKQKEVSTEVSSSSSQILSSTEYIFEESNVIKSITIENKKLIDNFFKLIQENYELLSNIQIYFHEVSGFSKKSELQVMEGVENLSSIFDELKLIQAYLKKVEEFFFNLNDSILEVSKILLSLSSIAKQTSLLSLNANVEAARAGEVGVGFTVVASEISKLSEQASGVVLKTKPILENIRNSSEDLRNSIFSALNISLKIHNKIKASKEVLDSFKKIISENQIYWNKVQIQTQKLNENSQVLQKSIEELLNFANEISNNAVKIHEHLASQDKAVKKLHELSNQLLKTKSA